MSLPPMLHLQPTPIQLTTVKGVIVDEQNIPYQGALIRFQANKPIKYGATSVRNPVIERETDSYGRFEVGLVPLDLGSDKDNYYNVTVIYDALEPHKVFVPSIVNTSFLTFSELLTTFKYTPTNPVLGSGILGDCNTIENSGSIGGNNDVVTELKWIVFEVTNATQTLYLAPSTIKLVTMNGLVMAEGIDYILTTFSTLQWIGQPLVVGDRLLVQYEVIV